MAKLSRPKRLLTSDSAYWTELHKELDDFQLEHYNPEIQEVINKTFMSVLQNSGSKGAIEAEFGDDDSYEDVTLLQLPFKAYQLIFRDIPSQQIPSLRLLTKSIKHEIDNKIGTQFIYDESILTAIFWAKTIGISKLIIKRMIHPIENFLTHKSFCFFTSPELLKNLQIDGPISSKNLQYILTICNQIEVLSLKIPYYHIMKEYYDELFPNITQPLPFNCFNVLKSLKITATLNEVQHNFIVWTLGPILCTIQSNKLLSLQLWIKCNLPRFNCLLDLIQEFLDKNLEQLSLRLPAPPVPADFVVKDAKATKSQLQKKKQQQQQEDNKEPRSRSKLTRLPNKLKTLELGDFSRLQMCSTDRLTFWHNLLLVQTQLTLFTAEIGPTFWKFYIPIIKQCSSTLKEIRLNQLSLKDSYNNGTTTAAKIEPFDFTMFENCRKLVLLKLSAINQYFSTKESTSVQNVNKLPIQLISIHFEYFQLTTTDIFNIHCWCTALRYINLQFWNSSRAELKNSLHFIEYIMKVRKYQCCILKDWKIIADYNSGNSSNNNGNKKGMIDTDDDDYYQDIQDRIGIERYNNKNSRKFIEQKRKLAQQQLELKKIKAAGGKFESKNDFLQLLLKLKNDMNGKVTTDNAIAIGVELNAK